MTYTVEYMSGNSGEWVGSDPEEFDTLQDVLTYCAEDTVLDGSIEDLDGWDIAAHAMGVGSTILHSRYGDEREPIQYRITYSAERYSIIRFYREGGRTVEATGLTLEQAQTHCRRDDTRGDGWFDGYELEA